MVWLTLEWQQENSTRKPTCLRHPDTQHHEFYRLFTKEVYKGSWGVLEKGMGTHSSTLTWRIPWIEEPGRLQSIGSQRVRHNWATEHTHTLHIVPKTATNTISDIRKVKRGLCHSSCVKTSPKQPSLGFWGLTASDSWKQSGLLLQNSSKPSSKIY